jgi:transposase InsO family protein
MLLVLLTSMVRAWKQALFIVQPETLLRWHRQGFKLFWRYKSKAASPKPKISQETICLIQEMARDNRLWRAERIRGELLKLGIHVCKRTIQKYMRAVRTTRPRGQTWRTFLHTHAQQIWACDFLPVTDLFFRSLFVFFIIELHSRKVIHVGVTRSPTDAWTVQQLREATAYVVGPEYLIRDNDSKFGVDFARVAKTSGIEMLKTPYHVPRANAICERFLGSVRRECLDHICSSCMRGNSTAFSRRIWPTSTRHDPIKGSSSRSLTAQDHLVSRHKQEPRCLPFRSWPVCTMSIEGWLKAETSAPTLHERAEECQGLIVDGQQTLERRPLALHPSRFREPLLPESSILLARWRCPL